MKPFNLIDDPWIFCVYDNDEVKEISLRQVFEDLPRIRILTGDIPQQIMPILRVILSIIYCAYAEKEDINWTRSGLKQLWLQTWENGSFDTELILNYLESYHERFNLFDDEHPFFQTPHLKYVGNNGYDPVNKLIPDVPKEDKFLFSLRAPQALKSISLSEAVRNIIFAQAYDVAGIKTPVDGNTFVQKGKVYAPKESATTGWDGAIGGLFAEGTNLFETLMLNWVLFDNFHEDEEDELFGRVGDLAPWEEDTSTTNMVIQKYFHGIINTLTLQSRRIRLIPDKEGQRVVGVVICYGDIVTPVNANRFEQMTAWRLSPAQQKKLGLPAPPCMPVTHDPKRALWRGLEPILGYVSGHADLRPGIIRWIEELRYNGWHSDRHPLQAVTLHAQGLSYGTQQSVIDAATDDSLCMNTILFRHDFDGINTVLDVVKNAEAGVKALSLFVRNLMIASGEDAKSKRLGDVEEQVRESAYASLDQLFRERIAAFTEDIDSQVYKRDWECAIHRELLDIGNQYLAQSSIAAFAYHECSTNRKQSEIMSTGRAQLIFQHSLTKILGTLASTESQIQSGLVGENDVITE